MSVVVLVGPGGGREHRGAQKDDSPGLYPQHSFHRASPSPSDHFLAGAAPTASGAIRFTLNSTAGFSSMLVVMEPFS